MVDLTADTQFPRARKKQLIVQSLPGELLIYDLNSHQAYCLNEASALIWKSCNGKRSVAELTRALESATDYPVDDSVVYLALDQLKRSGLLEQGIRLPVVSEQMSRRELARKVGIAIALLPLITSIIAPTAAQAATCWGLGSTCATNAQCCSNLCVSGTCGCIENQSPCDPTKPEQCCSGRCGSANLKCLP